MKKNKFKKCTVVDRYPNIKCNIVNNNRFIKVRFNSKTKQVFDEWDNEIGTGEMKEGKLFISQNVSYFG